MHDKTKSCKDCPDRTIQPNCHMTCEGYLARCERNEMIRAKKKEYILSNDYLFDMKMKNIYKKSKRK